MSAPAEQLKEPLKEPPLDPAPKTEATEPPQQAKSASSEVAPQVPQPAADKGPSDVNAAPENAPKSEVTPSQTPKTPQTVLTPKPQPVVAPAGAAVAAPSPAPGQPIVSPMAQPAMPQMMHMVQMNGQVYAVMGYPPNFPQPAYGQGQQPMMIHPQMMNPQMMPMMHHQGQMMPMVPQCMPHMMPMPGQMQHPQGPQGPQHPQGPQGPHGPHAAQGPQGQLQMHPQGPHGPQGQPQMHPQTMPQAMPQGQPIVMHAHPQGPQAQASPGQKRAVPPPVSQAQATPNSRPHSQAKTSQTQPEPPKKAKKIPQPVQPILASPASPQASPEASPAEEGDSDSSFGVSPAKRVKTEPKRVAKSPAKSSASTAFQIETSEKHVLDTLITESPRYTINGFECPQCDKVFKFRKHCRRHMVNHTTARPYQCPHCRNTYHRKDTCQRHVFNCKRRPIGGAPGAPERTEESKVRPAPDSREEDSIEELKEEAEESQPGVQSVEKENEPAAEQVLTPTEKGGGTVKQELQEERHSEDGSEPDDMPPSEDSKPEAEPVKNSEIPNPSESIDAPRPDESSTRAPFNDNPETLAPAEAPAALTT